MRDWQNFFTAGELMLLQHERFSSDQGLADVLNAKIREALEAAPKVYGEKCDEDDEFHWSESAMPNGWATHTGRIIDVKPIEKGE